MSKKPSISPETQALLKLIRLALGTEPRRYFGEPVEPFPDGINWKEVIRLSYVHKVSALAVDGLKSSSYDIYNGLNERQAQELKPIVDNWFNDIIKTEHSYAYYVEVLKTLCQIFAANGLKTIILKGYGLSLNYPIPSHRGAGDIDIYLIDRNGNQTSEKGDSIIKEVLGLPIAIDKKEHHSEFTFKGISVENHHNLSVASYKGECINYMNNTLKKEIAEGLIPCPNIEGAYIPSPIFEAMHLMRHTYTHFAAGKNNLRQFCDWSTFSQKHSESTKSSAVQNFYSKANMKDFAYGINCMIAKYLGFNGTTCQEFNYEDVNADGILNYTMYEPKHTGVRNIDYYYRNRWHCKFARNQHWLIVTIVHFFGKIESIFNSKKITI